jgi:putative ABC transport system permease protein
VLVGFVGGTLVALATIVVVWRRASGLDIGAAIRGRTAPARIRRHRPAGALPALRLAGLAIVIGGLASTDTAARAFAGVVALALAASVIGRGLSERARLSLLAAAIVAWTLVVAETLGTGDARSSMRLFVVLSLISVFSLSMLVAANIAILERVAGGLGRRSAAARQTLRPVLATLGQRPLRTGLTVGLFGIVLSLVTAAAAVLATDRPSSPSDTSPYQIVATTMGRNAVDIRPDAQVAAVGTVPFRIYRGDVSFSGRRIANITATIYEATPALAGLPLSSRAPSMKRDADAWQRVIYGDGAIGGFGIPGQSLVFDDSDVGVMNVGFLRPGGPIFGTIVAPSAFAAIPGELGTTYLIQTRRGVDAAALVHSLEKTWLPDGLDASTARALADRGSEDLRLFFAMIEFITRLALGVGVLALGIIGLRAAVERKQMLGTLRALGYKRRTIGAALLTEAAIVCTAGMVIGAGTGLALNRLFLRPTFAGLDLGMIGGTVALTYAAMLMVALGPAVRAARIRPADAVRVPD